MEITINLNTPIIQWPTYIRANDGLSDGEFNWFYWRCPIRLELLALAINNKQ